MSVAEYLELLDWTARLTIAGKRGAMPEDTPTIFERLSIDPMTWTILVRDFGRMFCQVAGNPKGLGGQHGDTALFRGVDRADKSLRLASIFI